MTDQLVDALEDRNHRRAPGRSGDPPVTADISSKCRSATQATSLHTLGPTSNVDARTQSGDNGRMRPIDWLDRRLAKRLPKYSYSGDVLFVSARRVLDRMLLSLIASALGVMGVALLDTEWKSVLSGALLAWSVSILIWSVSSYRTGRDETMQDLRRNAELDMLHGRLNLVSKHLGLPVIDLDAEWEHAVQARIERLAHFAGLDEFRLQTHTGPGSDFWTADALGRQ